MVLVNLWICTCELADLYVVELVDLSISSAYDASCDICIMAVMFV